VRANFAVKEKKLKPQTYFKYDIW